MMYFLVTGLVDSFTELAASSLRVRVSFGFGFQLCSVCRADELNSLPVVTSPVIRVIAMIKDNYTASSIAGGMVKAAGGCCPLDIVCGGIFKLPLMNTN